MDSLDFPEKESGGKESPRFFAFASVEPTTPTETARLQREIASADAELDSLVYSLYSLTPDEIRLVEWEGA